MLKSVRIIALASLGIALGCCGKGEAQNSGYYQAEKTDKLNTSSTTSKAKRYNEDDMKKLSEAFGNFIGRNLQSPGLKFDMESLIKGIRAGAAGEPSPLSEKEYEEMMASIQERAFQDMSESNLNAANEFMDKNRKEMDVREVVPGKLQYKILQEGSGLAVTEHASPKIHYTGKYHDGTVFGTSEEMGGPITIPLDQTIPGFSKGIVGMKEGEKRRLFVHPDLGYGTTGQLPPNELLIFDVEVLQANADDSKGDLDDEEIDLEDDEESDDDEKTNQPAQAGTRKFR